MDTLKLALKSRTIWTLAFLLAFNIFALYKPLIDPRAIALIEVILTTVAGYFKLSPSQNYGSEN